MPSVEQLSQLFTPSAPIPKHNIRLISCDLAFVEFEPATQLLSDISVYLPVTRRSTHFKAVETTLLPLSDTIFCELVFFSNGFESFLRQ